MKQWLPFLFATILVYETKSCLFEEKAALLEVKKYAFQVKEDNFRGDFPNSQLDLSSWVNNSKSDCCEWERVTCDSSSSHVIHLSLENMVDENLALVSKLNASVFPPFKQLRSLNLSSNGIIDWIPADQDSNTLLILPKLKTLDLSQNFLDKEIFKSLGALPILRSLFLNDNQIEGRYLDDKDSQSLKSFKMLETLDLSGNLFNESVLNILSGISSLKSLRLSHIKLSGPSPLPVQELSGFEYLELLDLSGNGFTSPKTVQGSDALFRMQKLKMLDLSLNFLDKEIFKSLSALPALKSLLLGNNDMHGSLDNEALANLTNLEVLIMPRSNFSGPLPVESLCRMKHLQELDLEGNKFGGNIHACFWNLTSLRGLDLSSNMISGNISSFSIARLPSLEYLSLQENKFEGLLSLSSFANNSKLKVLALGGKIRSKLQVETENTPWIPSFQLKVLEIINCQVNSPTRTMPSFLRYQYDLIYIDLSYNNLVGKFPNWLLVNNPSLEVLLLHDNFLIGKFLLPADGSEDMHQLLHLGIANNKIQGLLPKSIGLVLPNLHFLDVSSNMFHGEIPASIGNMSRLLLLNLANNNFFGEIPKHVLSGCASLSSLRLSNNSLWGQVFPRPLNWGQLSFLMMDNNQFNGTLGEGLLSMPFLSMLDLSGNRLSGKLPSWIGNITRLTYLSVAHNNFEDALPEKLCNLVQLVAIKLSYNRFSGAIPSCFGNMYNLEFINFQRNGLTGTIPDALLRVESLVTVDLRDNKLSGYNPRDMHELELKLKFLLLAGNRLTGQLPNHICQLKELNFLDLSRNNFSGSILTCLNNMSFGKKDVDYDSFNIPYQIPSGIDFIIYHHSNFRKVWVEENTYENSIQEEVQLLTKSLVLSYKGDILNYMFGIDLSSNQLTGEIPRQIGDLISLHVLNLSYNHLNGSIPESFHKLRELESLDLSYNNLSGNFPPQLQDMNSLEIFNVSYNNLTGRVPNNGQFGTFDESSYKGNPYLFWENSNRGIVIAPPLTSSKMKEEDDFAIDFTFFYWSFAVSYVMVLLTFVTILWINPYWRRMWFYLIESCLYKCFYQFH